MKKKEPLPKETKALTVFDVLAAMPHESTKITYDTVGGRQLSKKRGGGAAIEFAVDNDTFQDYAYQATYREPKTGKGKMVTLAVFFWQEEYHATLDKLKKL